MSASPPSLLLKFSISFKTSRLANYSTLLFITGVYQLSVLKSHHHIIASLSASNQQSVLFSWFFFFIGMLLFIYAQVLQLQNLRTFRINCLCQAAALHHPKCLQGMPPPRLAQLVFPHANRMTLILTS